MTMTPDEIARTLAAMDLVEPLELSEDEEAQIEAARRERKQWDKDHFNERAAKLAENWESLRQIDAKSGADTRGKKS